MQTILTIETKIQRHHSIAVDGTAYELRDPKEFSPFQRRQYPKIAARIKALEAAEAPSKSEEKEYADLLAKLCAMIVDAPAEVLAKLTASQCQLVVGVYAALRALPAKPAHPATKRTRKRR